jgi:hypothetical protein
MRTRSVVLLVHLGILGILGAGCADLVGLGDSPVILAGDADGADGSAPEPRAEAGPDTLGPTPLEEAASDDAPLDATADAGADDALPTVEDAPTEAVAPGAAPPDGQGLILDAGPDAPAPDATVGTSTWCSLQEGGTICADFDEPDALALFVRSVSSGDIVTLDEDAAYSPPAALASTLVGTQAGVYLAAQVQTNLPAADGGMFVLGFALWIDPGCVLAPLNKVYVATLTSDQTTFWGPVVYNAGDGGFELRIAHFDTLGNSLIDILGRPVLFGTWVDVHYAYCPSISQDSIATGAAPAACQVPPSGTISPSVFAVGLRTDGNEQPLSCTVLIDNVRLDEF